MNGERLMDQHPRLAHLLNALPDEQRSRRVARLAEHAAEVNGVADDCRASRDLAGLLDRYDVVAWSCQGLGDLATAAYAEYAAAFRRARAVNAWMIVVVDSSFTGSCAAVYEAMHALDIDEDRVVVLLGQ